MNKGNFNRILYLLSICVAILGVVLAVFSLAVILMSGLDNVTAGSFLIPVICLVVGLAGVLCKNYYKKKM